MYCSCTQYAVKVILFAIVHVPDATKVTPLYQPKNIWSAYSGVGRVTLESYVYVTFVGITLPLPASNETE